MQPPFNPDPLDHALRRLHLEGAFYFRSLISAPWGALISSGPASLHYIIEGTCVLEAEAFAEPLTLQTGDLVVLPHGEAYTMKDHPSRVAPPFHELHRRYGTRSGTVLNDYLHKPGPGPMIEMVCIGFAFDDAVPHPLIEALPPVLHLRDAARQGTPWLTQTLDFLACESRSRRPGAESVMGHLAGILFIQAVRAHFDQCAETATRSGWLRGLRDAQLGPVLRAVQEEPGATWTVDAMADRSGLSRSAFAARFRDLVGEPPMQHVTRWRIYRAAQLLRHEHLTLGEVAQRVGYANEAAFSRTFKRWTDSPPGAFRSARAASAPMIAHP